MSMYAVVDPATGETLKEYPTITDDELRDAIARADRAHREWSRAATVQCRRNVRLKSYSRASGLFYSFIDR